MAPHPSLLFGEHDISECTSCFAEALISLTAVSLWLRVQVTIMTHFNVQSVIRPPNIPYMILKIPQATYFVDSTKKAGGCFRQLTEFLVDSVCEFSNIRSSCFPTPGRLTGSTTVEHLKCYFKLREPQHLSFSNLQRKLMEIPQAVMNSDS